MTGFIFIILFGLSSLLFPFEGKVSAPSTGTSMVFARGSTERITWSFDDVITPLTRRVWSVTSRDARPLVALALIDGDGPVRILTTLFDVSVEKPATLVLRNVNLTYNGTYKFDLLPSSGAASSEVVVYIAGKLLIRKFKPPRKKDILIDWCTCGPQTSGGLVARPWPLD